MARIMLRYMAIPDQRKEIKVIPIGKTRRRRIHQCPPSLPDVGDIKSSPPKFVFGPLYPEQQLSSSGKEDAWLKVLEEDGEGGMNRDETIEIYLSAIRRVEKRARSTYNDGELNRLTKPEFRWMMLKDGCFFLHLALYILGASKQLGYPEKHLIFGQKQSKKTLQEWIKSMFLVGNQIPLVVLNELMKQNFFQKVIKGIKEWPRPSDMLSKQILHDLIVIPALEYKSTPNSNLRIKLARKTYSPDVDQVSDLLHGLQLFLLGPGSSSTADPIENEQEDELEDRDLESGITVSVIHQKIGEKEMKNKDDERKELRASELRNKGVFIWKSEKAGSRGIDFKNWIIFSSLTLPTLKVSHDTNVLFSNLKYYEITHKQNEVRSYLRFMSELISTYEDVNILVKKGIVEANTREEKERFLKMLRKLAD